MEHMTVIDGSDLWAWKESNKQPMINWYGTYDYPVIHRVGCFSLKGVAYPSISEEAMVVAWEAELQRRAKGSKRVEFCEHCTCDKVN